MPLTRCALCVAALVSVLLAATATRAVAQPLIRLQLTAPALMQSVAPAAALRDVMPRTSQDKRLVGWILVGAGIVHLALTPVCISELHAGGGQVACLGATAVLGMAAIAVGTWFLIEGYGASSRPIRRHRAQALPEPKLLVSLGAGQGLVFYRGHW